VGIAIFLVVREELRIFIMGWREWPLIQGGDAQQHRWWRRKNRRARTTEI